MRKKMLLVFGFWLSLVCFGQNKILPIIPKPFSVEIHQGNFLLSSKTKFNDIDSLPGSWGNYFNEFLKKNANFSLENSHPFKADAVNCIMAVFHYEPVFKGGYTLLIDKNEIWIDADSDGVFYAIQTLIQLIGNQAGPEIKIPCCKISDYPVYSWRGMHLDCSRHFFSKAEVEKYLDYLALYKFNVFHWHLCDDQGWRIEIKKYPLLTQIGSVRKETVVGKQSDKAKGDGKPYGGFYSQDDIKEIVAYATARHITVVPEIEMPGHSLAALSAYPQFSCTGGPFAPATTWGVFDDVYCAGNDSVFDFLENILSEVCQLFPGKYIHIGGDECPKTRWEKCPKCQKRIKDEKLKDEHELQSYFVQRIEKFLNSKGKQIIGWDEILEGGLAPNATVMSWRGMQGGIDAAKQLHDVVMTPGNPCYFDHYQSKNKKTEPLAISGYNPLDSVYNYDPTPKVLPDDEKMYILGAQGNVWTEYIANFKQVEYMSIPRMCALSEVLWTNPKKKNYADFIARLKLQTLMLDKMKINYAKHFLLNN